MRDLVIGVVSGYKTENVKPWASSLRATGFDGDIALVAFNTTDEFKAIEEQYKVVTYNFGDLVPDTNVVVQRFFEIADLLETFGKNFTNVISTDVRDVHFQRNPSEWLEANLKSHGLLAAREGFKYKDEPWGDYNLKEAFPDHYTTEMLEWPICCAGVIAGKTEELLHLARDVYFKCQNAPQFVRGGGGPDQAAYNILLNTPHYRDMTLFTSNDDAWSCQVGTTKLAIDAGAGAIGLSWQLHSSIKLQEEVKQKFASVRIDNDPVIINNELCTHNCEKYAIVHQYDRAPILKTLFEKREPVTITPSDKFTIRIV